MRFATLGAPTPGGLTIYGRFSDGSFLASPGWTSLWHGSDVRTGVIRDSISLIRFGPDGEALDTLGRWPGSELFVLAQRGGGAYSGARFARATQLAVHGDRFYVGTQDAYEVAVYRPDGAIAMTIRWHGA